MFTRNILMTGMCLFFISMSVVAQEKQKSNDGRPVITKEAAEKARRQAEMLENPYFIKLTVVPEAEPTDNNIESSGPYKAGSKIKFRLIAVNTLTEPFNAPIILDSYIQYRLELLKDGRLLPYRQGIAKLVKEKDERSDFTSLYAAQLKPNEAPPLGIIKLDEWYEQLEPGLYELTVKHRFLTQGKWNQAPMITFEVVLR